MVAAVLVVCGCTPEEQAAVALWQRSRPIPERIHARWVAGGASESDAVRAVRVSWCESRHNPRAANPTSSARGLFQHLAMHWRGKFDPFDPEASIEHGFRLWRRSGWGPWNASRRCWA